MDLSKPSGEKRKSSNEIRSSILLLTLIPIGFAIFFFLQDTWNNANDNNEIKVKTKFNCCHHIYIHHHCHCCHNYFPDNRYCCHKHN